MKNIEKYPNTKDALEAWNKYRESHSDDGIFRSFYLWLEDEYIEPKPPTLLEAAQAVVHELDKIDWMNRATWLDNFKNAVKREEKKPLRNCDVYRTVEEACKAYGDMCYATNCYQCSFGNRKREASICSINWLFSPYEGGAK